MSNENKTTLRLGIDKTIQPKQYEPIKIQVLVEESFNWESNEDREKKMKIYRERMTDDFIKTFDHVAVKIGEKDRCIGLVNPVNSSEENQVEGKKEILSSDNEENDKEWDFD